MAGKTIEPRLTFTPAPGVGQLLREVAEAQRTTPAKVVRELLNEMAPAMRELLVVYREANRRPQLAREAAIRMGVDAEDAIRQASLDLEKAIRRKPGRKPGNKGQGAAKTG